MFSDMRGYSALMDRDESLALELIDEHNTLVRSMVEAQRGQVIKLLGDGVLSCFESGADAVGCAIDIQRHLAQRNASCPPGHEIVLRIGIHIGDITLRDDDAFGHGVNVAARIEALAEPGGICITQTVYDIVRSRPGFSTVSLGPHELKNISESVNLYRVLVDSQDGGSVPVKRSGRGRLLAAVAALVVIAAALVFGRAVLWPADEAPADPCTCLGWGDVDFSLSDAKTGAFCNSGPECATVFALEGNQCADPIHNGYSWCYVHDQCETARPSNDGARAWRRCSDQESGCECLDWADASAPLRDADGLLLCESASECVERFGLAGNACADPGGVRGQDWCYTTGRCPSALETSGGRSWWKGCKEAPGQ